LIVVLLVAECSREPDFSERYDAASEKIGATANEIDAEIESRALAADEGAASTEPEATSGRDGGSPAHDGP